MRVVLASFALLVAAPGVLGCTATHEGRLMVVVTSDIPLDALASVHAEVAEETHDFPLVDGSSLPFSFVVAARPDRAPELPVTIEVSGLGHDGSVLVTRPFTTTFVPNRTLVVTIDLARRCSTAAGCSEPLRCGPGEACTATGCTSSVVRSASLPDLRAPGDELGNAAGTSYTPTEACAALGALNCSALLRCCPALVGVSTEDLDRARRQCDAGYAEYCTNTLVPLLEDPMTGCDPLRAAAAIAEGQRLADDCSLSFADWGTSFEVGLFSAMRGTIAVGDRCFLDQDRPQTFFSCLGGACLPNGLTLHCTERACADEACAGDFPLADYGCGDGLYCAQRGASFVCARRLAVGEACTRDSQCASQLCDEDGTVAGTCQVITPTLVFCPDPMAG